MSVSSKHTSLLFQITGAKIFILQASGDIFNDHKTNGVLKLKCPAVIIIALSHVTFQDKRTARIRHKCTKTYTLS
jgi:hypothetical protein